MPFIEAQAVRAVLALVLGSAILVGIAFAAFAGYLGLLDLVQPAWAALIVAAAILVPVFVGAMVVRGHGRHPVPREKREAVSAATQNPDAAAMGLIANLAKEKPLLAVLFAGLLGAAGTLLQQKNRVN